MGKRGIVGAVVGESFGDLSAIPRFHSAGEDGW
jgi:hypothetical protein